MEKKIVQFLGEPYFINVGGDQEVAHVYAVDHPRLGMTSVRTSLVVQKYPGGSFETLNTMYVPYKENNEVLY